MDQGLLIIELPWKYCIPSAAVAVEFVKANSFTYELPVIFLFSYDIVHVTPLKATSQDWVKYRL